MHNKIGSKVLMTEPRIGLVLGGGGARGMAHIPVLEALDDLNVKPRHIVGTSIGAVIGAGYATGLSGSEIREYVVETFSNYGQVISNLWKLRPQSILESLTNWNLPQFDARNALELYVGSQIPDRFEELQIPLSVVATDYHNGRVVQFQSGCLKSAISASIAIPILFKPVKLENKILVDGGLVNPLPIDLLPSDIDFVIAVDVLGSLNSVPGREEPTSLELLFNSAQISMQALTSQQLKANPNAILVKPDISKFRMLDFFKTEEIIKVAESEKEILKGKLKQILSRITG